MPIHCSYFVFSEKLLLQMLVYLLNAARDLIYEASKLAFLAGEMHNIRRLVKNFESALD